MARAGADEKKPIPFPNTRSREPGASRRTRGFATASGAASSTVRGALAKRGIAEARLITHWAEIAGEQLADVCRPIRVRYNQSGMALGGVLVLAVTGAAASEVEHRIPAIIERVNAFYGYNAIAKVKLTQAIAPLEAAPEVDALEPRPVTPELSAEKQRALESMTAPIEDDALRSALRRLGANVMSQPPKRATIN